MRENSEIRGLRDYGRPMWQIPRVFRPRRGGAAENIVSSLLLVTHVPETSGTSTTQIICVDAQSSAAKRSEGADPGVEDTSRSPANGGGRQPLRR